MFEPWEIACQDIVCALAGSASPLLLGTSRNEGSLLLIETCSSTVTIVLEGTRRIVVEVKTSANGDDPMEAIDDVKAHRIRRAVQGYELPVYRIDAIAVRLTPGGVSVRWLKAVL